MDGIERCKRCDKPLLAHVASDVKGLCGACVAGMRRWQRAWEQAKAQEAFVRGTNPDGPDAA